LENNIDKKEQSENRKKKLYFLENLFTKFYNFGKPKYFKRPYVFHIVQLEMVKDKPKVSII